MVCYGLCLRIVTNSLKNANSPYPGRLLRHGRKRPRRRTAECRDELAPSLGRGHELGNLRAVSPDA
jgi:hypothetical protein